MAISHRFREVLGETLGTMTQAEVVEKTGISSAYIHSSAESMTRAVNAVPPHLPGRTPDRSRRRRATSRPLHPAMPPRT